MKHTIDIDDRAVPKGFEPLSIAVPGPSDDWVDGGRFYYGLSDKVTRPKYPCLIIRRKVRKYDWGRTLDDVLVNIDGESGYYSLRTSKCVPSPREGIADIWQANIHGKCPVDPDTAWIRAELSTGTTEEGTAGSFSWVKMLHPDCPTVMSWQFIRLVDGAEW